MASLMCRPRLALRHDGVRPCSFVSSLPRRSPAEVSLSQEPPLRKQTDDGQDLQIRPGRVVRAVSIEVTNATCRPASAQRQSSGMEEQNLPGNERIARPFPWRSPKAEMLRELSVCGNAGRSLFQCAKHVGFGLSVPKGGRERVASSWTVPLQDNPP